MARKDAPPRPLRFGYNLFIFALTIFSFFITTAILLPPLNTSVVDLLWFYDIVICIFFLLDFFLCLNAAPNKSQYFLKEGGWLDLIGSIPAIGSSYKILYLLRLARLNRFFRILRLMRVKNREDYINDLLENRSEYTGFITILLAIIILATASVFVLEFESASPDAKIRTGWDAIWYSVVTITTVGYGDYYPVTFGGRATAIFIMSAGVGIIGVLASLLSSALIGEKSTSSDKAHVESSVPPLSPLIEEELSSIKKELSDLRQLLEKMSVEDMKK
jgi:voltage-gated potassium channel